jgi:hypothetical protein
MNLRSLTIGTAIAIAGAFSLLAVPAAAAPFGGLMASGDFEVFSQDDAGGGWVIHKVPLKGDLLWGCGDVATVDRCDPVPLPDFMPATSLAFIHIDKDTMAAWLRVSVPVFGDSLMACYSPEDKPYCEKIKLELAPPMTDLKRVWPDYAAGAAAPAGGGGMMGGMMGGGDSGPPKGAIMEDGSKGDMWLSAGIVVPGPINLYACKNLNEGPVCGLSVPGIYLIRRSNVGFKKVSAVTNDKGKVRGILIEELDEGSAAMRAKLKPGDIIKRVGGFKLKSVAHFRGLLTQWPATYKIPIELKGGDMVKIKVRKGGSGKKKKRR